MSSRWRNPDSGSPLRVALVVASGNINERVLQWRCLPEGDPTRNVNRCLVEYPYVGARLVQKRPAVPPTTRASAGRGLETSSLRPGSMESTHRPEKNVVARAVTRSQRCFTNFADQEVNDAATRRPCG